MPADEWPARCIILAISDPAALPTLRAAIADQTRTTENEDVSVSEIAQKAIARLEAAVKTQKPLTPCPK